MNVEREFEYGKKMDGTFKPCMYLTKTLKGYWYCYHLNHFNFRYKQINHYIVFQTQYRKEFPEKLHGMLFNVQSQTSTFTIFPPTFKYRRKYFQESRKLIFP